MRRLFAFGVFVVAAACNGTTPPSIDADSRGPLCTGAVYDNCNDEHDCMSGHCNPFGTIQVCTQQCTMGGSACPADSTGAAGTCAASGFCQPAAANTCHL